MMFSCAGAVGAAAAPVKTPRPPPASAASGRVAARVASLDLLIAVAKDVRVVEEEQAPRPEAAEGVAEEPLLVVEVAEGAAQHAQELPPRWAQLRSQDLLGVLRQPQEVRPGRRGQGYPGRAPARRRRGLVGGAEERLADVEEEEAVSRGRGLRARAP